MSTYDELIKSLKDYRNISEEDEHSVLKKTAEAIEALQSVVDEKQKLLDVALKDLAKSSECKYCSNLDKCSLRRVERTLAYGNCAEWKWRGANTADIAS
ncbi:MAG: hypothetical protein QMB62_07555 [Oscillospiraceae bacterium]